jgi:maltose O-acetyltransferase
MNTLGKILHNPAAYIFQELQASYYKQRYESYRKLYDVHPSVLYGDGTVLYGDGEISIGEGSYFGRNCLVNAVEGHKVKIGCHCAMSHYIAIYTQNRQADQDFSKTCEFEFGNVTIGDYCWIGYGVFIKQGVTIGKNCVIGAHSVVLEDIPDYSIAAGAPAKVVKVITNNSGLSEAKK